ncbi:MAG: hypothetical protein NXI22_26025, partial [bacterium]|nr:hypothetical protein [bacterium]
NLLKALKRFLRWLHTCEDFEWRKPEDMHAISTKIATLEHETRSKQITAEDLFTLDDLTLLYRYGQPLERVLILLGLNCGFSVAESSTLLVNEIHLRSAHPARFQEFLDFESTNEHSFIKRHRRKNGIYGEFLLWEHTVGGIEWALKRRRKQPEYNPTARLLLNGEGKPFDRRTAGGNPCRQISNMFARLKRRIQEDGQTVSDLPFKCFRKTGGDLVKTISGGETMAVFHCRGEVKEAKDNLADAYSTRKFGKVFRALQQVEKRLAPMFAGAGEEPFRHQPQAYTKKSTIDRILKLHREGILPADIAEEVGMSPSAVQRHITKVTGPRRPGPRKKTR